jgi:hypothetical protein
MLMVKPNNYCQYVEGPCPSDMQYPISNSLFFAYPSQPETSADAIKGVIQSIRDRSSLGVTVTDWRDLPIEGGIVFCEICKAIQQSSCVVLNITNANFNVLFEYGFALGSGKSLYPMVEEGIDTDKRTYSEIETLTTLGYAHFTNSAALFKRMLKKMPWSKKSPFNLPSRLGEEPTSEATGLLYVKSTHNNEPSLRISEYLSLQPIEVIIDDPSETPFQSFFWYLNRIRKAYAVLINLGSPNMLNVKQHWAKCALVAGMSLALGRRILMIGENILFKPIDYRELIRIYKNASSAEKIVSEFLSPIIEAVRLSREYSTLYSITQFGGAQNVLNSIDLGEYIAENERQGLNTYFIETPEFSDAFTPQFKVYVGRKGTGKTANYYMILSRLLQDKRNIVCQIKPKEYELNELLQFIKTELDVAKKGYLLESLWKFMLYSEILKTAFTRISEKPIQAVGGPAERAILEYVTDKADLYDKSFTSRLVETVRLLCRNAPEPSNVAVSEILHTKEIAKIHKMVCEYMSKNVASFAVVIDGLDSNWRMGEDYKIMADILLSLIGAARDMWRACKDDIDKIRATIKVSVLIFLRGDVFRVVLARAREPDKLIYTQIYWPNVDSLLKVIEKRIVTSLGKTEGEVFKWQDYLEPGFTLKTMKEILENNILLRPRDIICYFQNAIYQARSRGTKYVTKRDFSSAMRDYSEYALRSLAAESQPYIPDMTDLLFEFAERPALMTRDELHNTLLASHIEQTDFSKTINFLFESNFLGYGIDDYNYTFPTSPAGAELTLRRALRHSEKQSKVRTFKIHRAFHEALAIV